MSEAERAALQQKHRDFSENYLEKLINIELAMPVPSREQSQALLAPAPDPPAWQGWAVRIRAVMDWVYELGPSVVAVCLLLLAFYFTPLPPIAAKAPLSVPPVQASVQSIASQPAAAETAVS